MILATLLLAVLPQQTEAPKPLSLAELKELYSEDIKFSEVEKVRARYRLQYDRDEAAGTHTFSYHLTDEEQERRLSLIFPRVKRMIENRRDDYAPGSPMPVMFYNGDIELGIKDLSCMISVIDTHVSKDFMFVLPLFSFAGESDVQALNNESTDLNNGYYMHILAPLPLPLDGLSVGAPLSWRMDNISSSITLEETLGLRILDRVRKAPKAINDEEWSRALRDVLLKYHELQLEKLEMERALGIR